MSVLVGRTFVIARADSPWQSSFWAVGSHLIIKYSNWTKSGFYWSQKLNTNKLNSPIWNFTLLGWMPNLLLRIIHNLVNFSYLLYFFCNSVRKYVIIFRLYSCFSSLVLKAFSYTLFSIHLPFLINLVVIAI